MVVCTLTPALVAVTVAPASGAEVAESVIVPVRVPTGPVVQDGNLKEPIRVCQLKEPVVCMYTWVYQKVQSSAGSRLSVL